MTIPAFNLVGRVDVKVKRIGEGTYEQGNWIGGEPTFLNITANVQPIMAKDGTKIMPDGDFSRSAVKIFTTVPLYEKREGFDGTGADVIEWEGDEYEVMKVIRYRMGVLDHYMSVAIQVPRT